MPILATPLRAARTTGRFILCLPEKPFESIHVGWAAGKEEIVCSAGFLATYHDGYDTGGLHVWGRCLLTLEGQSLRGLAYVFGIRSKALRRWHDPIDIDGETLGAGGAGWDTGMQRDPGRNFGRLVLIVVFAKRDCCDIL